MVKGKVTDKVNTNNHIIGDLPRSSSVQQPIGDVIIEFEANPLRKEMTRLRQAVLSQSNY